MIELSDGKVYPAIAGVRLLMVGLVFCLCGCGEEEAPREFGQVSGTVTYKGKPIERGKVIFQHVEGPVIDAPINSDGTYTQNVAVGNNRIAVDYREPDIQEGGVRKEVVPGKSIIPKEYATPTTSPLQFNVAPGPNTFDIKIP